MGAPADPQRSRIVRFAVEHRIPAMYEFREYVSDGGLLSYGPNLMEMFRRSATDADKILNGAQPSDIPIERPTKLELSVNLEAAKAARPDDPAVAAAAGGRGVPMRASHLTYVPGGPTR
jgi:hypothetical protein